MVKNLADLLLDTARLQIRPFRNADLNEAVGLFSDVDFMSGSLDGTLSPDAAAAKLRTLIGLYEAHGFSKLALIERVSGRIIGYCGLGLEIIDGNPTPEFGYRLHAVARGKGYATEASRAVLSDAFGRLRMTEVHAIALSDNIASRRVLDKLGMIYLRDVAFRDKEWMLYRLERSA